MTNIIYYMKKIFINYLSVKTSQQFASTYGVQCLDIAKEDGLNVNKDYK